MSDDVREKLSALVDGELGDDEAVDLLDKMSHDSALKDVWERYHLVSDVLRNHLSPVTPAEEDEGSGLETRGRLCPGGIGCCSGCAGFPGILRLRWRTSRGNSRPA